MAIQPRTPGVYIEEIRKFPPSVAGVDTAIPAFIGYTMKAREKEDDDLDLVPKRIVSLLEYELYFGTAAPETITVTIEDTTDGRGNVIDRKANGAVSTPSPHNLYYAMQAYFANGGGPCYIVSVDLISNEPASVTQSKLNAGLETIRKEDEITLIVFPEASFLTSGADYATLMGAALNMCGDLQDRFTVMDLQIPEGTGAGILDAAGDFRDLSLPISNLKYGACYAPNVLTTFDYIFDDSTVSVIHIEDGVDTVGTGGMTLADLKPSDSDPTSGDLILYNVVLAAIDQVPVMLPPSPLVVGQYAFVDNGRGVWKAPANVALQGVIKPSIKITNQEQDQLNVHSTGKSINAIRAFTGKGILIWGARTLAGNDNEWRYVSVRRYFNFAEESIKKATEQFVFEPNDANTWSQVRAMIENFLILQWRAGALAGAKPADAFFVRVGLGVTMTALDILEGRMNVEIGLAVVRPAEFIILKFSHKMQVS
jgi:hypothetical protein